MISTTTIERIREIDIFNIASKYLSDLKLKGHRATTCCPFHKEKTPSFHVDIHKQYYKCFGCGKGGDGISFVQEQEKVGFYDALKIIAQSFSINIEYTAETQEQTTDRELLFNINQEVQNIYRKQFDQLPANHPMRSHLQQRGYTEEEILQWQIGYANNRGPLSTLFLEGKNYQAGIDLGLIKKSTMGITNDVFYNRIIFPIQDHNGRTVGFTGRVVESDTKAPKYMNSKKSPIFHKSKILFGLNHAVKEIRKSRRCYLVEGQTDVISFHQHELYNTVATSGTALTEDHAKLLKRNTDTVVLAMDGDTAGRTAAMKAVNILLAHEISVGIVELKIEKK